MNKYIEVWTTGKQEKRKVKGNGAEDALDTYSFNV